MRGKNIKDWYRGIVYWKEGMREVEKEEVLEKQIERSKERQ